MKATCNSWGGAAREPGPRIGAEAVETRDEPGTLEAGAKTVDALPLDIMGEVLSLFSDPDSFRKRLDYIAQNLNAIAGAWSRPRLPDPDVTLGVLQELATNGAIPPGCEQAQETLMSAIERYRQASEGVHRAKLDARPSEREAAWERVREGNALLGQAIKLVDEE
jgi:hypothetical protein